MTSASAPPDLKAHGLSPEEYRQIQQQLGRDPNPTELAMFGVMWSEHCCYKNSRPLLKHFPTTGERVVVGPGENAGVVDLGDGDWLAFKIESHNHPSAVEPFQGAATGVGGILRDIFTLGARPIALLNSLRFGPLTDPRNRRLMARVVEGIAHYGNCVGVPTVGGEVAVDPCYSGNPLVNVMALGLLETPAVVKSAARGVGNPILYVGATTGRDGIRGASFASAELKEDAQQDRPAVQVGDPFLGKCLIEACLEAFATGAVVAAQDMGAAGITCSTAEMAAKGGVGIRFDLDRVPARESGMAAWEYLLSESQERMLLVVQKGREAEVMEIFHRWGLQASVAGEVIAEPLVEIWHQGSCVVRVPARALAEDTPVYVRPLLPEPPEYVQAAWQWDPATLPPCDREGIHLGQATLAWQEVLLQLLAPPTLASKAWIYRQYDHQVQNNTVLWPGQGDAAVIRIRSQKFGVGEVPPLQAARKAIAATLDGNGRWVYLDPYEGAKAAVAEAARNLSCVGADPLAITDNLNFGSPENPVVYWQLALACRGIAEACRALGTPVTGGERLPLQREGIPGHLPHPRHRHGGPHSGLEIHLWPGVAARRGSRLPLGIPGRHQPGRQRVFGGNLQQGHGSSCPRGSGAGKARARGLPPRHPPGVGALRPRLQRGRAGGGLGRSLPEWGPRRQRLPSSWIPALGSGPLWRGIQPHPRFCGPGPALSLGSLLRVAAPRPVAASRTGGRACGSVGVDNGRRGSPVVSLFGRPAGCLLQRLCRLAA